ncbi:MAG: choice-of-anchor D domain-containing protein [Bacteroidetes bacterium]|nr:choice-of-anchor D domain-containing protein [Bacteroidota bacterium]
MQATSSANQYIRDAPSGSTILSSIAPGKLIVSDAIVSGWYRCYFPHPTYSTQGYALGGSGFLVPYLGAYVTVQNTFTSGLRIRQFPSTASSNFVMIGSSPAKVWDGSKYACTGNITSSEGSVWYEIQLSNNCVPNIGWVSNGAATGSNYLVYTPATVSSLPSINVSGSLLFGNVSIATIQSRTITITNSGSSTLSIYSVNCPAGFSGSWSGNILPGNSQNIEITFSPATANVYSGSVVINSNAPTGAYSLPCSGTGISAASSAINLSGALSFGNTELGSSNSRVLTIKNTGSAILNVSSIVYPDGFTGNWSGRIAPGAMKEITITFTPISIVSYGGNVTVYSNASTGINSIYCSGNGISTINPSPFLILSGDLNFGTVATNTSLSRTLNISNTGTANLNIASISYPTGFTGNWSGNINPGETKNVTVIFKPTSAHQYSGTITVSSNGGNRAIFCSGNGVSNNVLTIPTGLKVSAISSSEIEISWNNSVNATSYLVYSCNGTFIGETSTTKFLHTKLKPNTIYSYKVAANSAVACSEFSICKGTQTLNGSSNSVQCILDVNDYIYGTTAPSFDCMSEDENKIDGYGFWMYTCTSWLGWKINQELGSRISPYKFSNGEILGVTLKDRLGNAGNWGLVLDGLNINGTIITADNVPTVGSIGWYKMNAPGIGRWGHVAFVNCVEKIDGKTHVTLTEYNGGALTGQDRCRYARRQIVLEDGDKGGNRIPTKFIHIERLKNKNTSRDRAAMPTVSVFPNPASDAIKVALDGGFSGDEILTITDGMGTIVHREDAQRAANITLSISALNNGLYILRIISNNYNINKHFQIIK